MSFFPRLWRWGRRRKARPRDGGCRVFISYNTHQREDRTLAKGLRDCLVNCSLDAVFRDEESLRPGDDWEKVIDAEIERCSHLVVFITEAMQGSDQVLREVEVAKEVEAKIVPVIIGEPRRNPVSEIHAIRLTQSRYIESLTHDVEEICQQVTSITGVRKNGRLRGRLLPYLCDRAAIEEALRGRMSVHRAEKRDQPAVMFVCGSADDRPEHFTTRMIDGWIRKWIVDQETAALEPLRIQWIEGVAADSTVRGLKQRLIDELGLPDDDPSDDGFVRQMCNLGRKGLVIVHTLRCEAWDPDETPLAIARYLELWEKVGKAPKKPFVIVVFNILYSDAAEQAERRAGKSSVRASLLAAVKKWSPPAAAISAIVSADLPAVEREDVDTWFDVYAPQVAVEEKKQMLDSLFAGGKKLPMSVVEPELQRFVN